ncbi:MAG TPA: IPT/TIG domain-containing protein [Thermoanaerobaculia bacterium]|nr:IPT/TIG domain-containing protein [Thermoanaerobaculia bacterium]
MIFSTSGAPDNTPPTVVSVAPGAGNPAVAASSNVTATFSEPLDPSTVTSSTFTLQGPGAVSVPAAVTYNSATLRAILDPSSSLAFSTSYTATVKSGPSGVKDTSGNALANDFTWSFTTAGPPPPPPDQGPGGPILVLAGANTFGRFFAEILRTEGLNEFDVKDIGTVDAGVLSAYDVVVLGQQTLTGGQVTMLSDWVTAGGNLIAMRPDPQLAGLLGLTVASGTLSNAYYKVDTSAAPGAGIVSQTMQFHGTADKYTLSGATAVATLYSTANTATANPAVTVRSVGTSGGHAAAFTFDLARSVVYTRQGNPAWAGDSRDGQDGPIRSDNLYFGAKPGDVQPDWVDFANIAIPQADEAQRLLANLIGTVNLPRKPLPRFWYFPKSKKAVVVMTGDDHANGGTAGRFDSYKAASPAGCSVADWECIRSTSYVYPSAPLTDAQAASYEADGFEVGAHITTGCADFTPASLASDFSDQLATFGSNYPSVAPPITNRTHCIPWSDWSTHPKTELAHGIRLDTNYYYWPPTWINDRPGMFTGSGMPMRFADLDGTMIDVYQAATQMTDESGQTFPKNIDSLLDKATGPEGYYGAFTANMHTDSAQSDGSDAIIASAKSHGVPVVSSRQMLTWLDGRNGSSFSGLSWSGGTLSFTINLGAGAANMQAMLPATSSAGALTGVTRNGSAVVVTTQTIKGVAYAFVPALAGVYAAQYAVDSTPPAISALNAAPGAGGTALVTWTTDEPSTSRVDFGTSSGTLSANVSDGALVTSHSLALTSLAASTTYYYRVTSADASGNPATSPNPPAPPASFTMPSPSFVDTTVADFSAGTPGTGTAVVAIGDGDVILAPTVEAEFGGTALPSGWSSATWDGGGSAVVSGGSLVVDGADAATDASYGPGEALEFVATFGAATFQHAGFVDSLAFNGPFAIFSTGNTSDTLFARTSDGQQTVVPGTWLNSPHRYRIEWNASNVLFYADGALVATHAVSFAGPLRPVVSDFASGSAALSVDWIRMTPYVSSGSFTSRVFDAGQSVSWGALSWTAQTPSGTTVALSASTGNTPVPDGSWTPFASVANGGPIGGSSRYVQYRADLATSDPSQTPVLQSVALAYATVPPPSISGFTPASGPVGTSVSISGSGLTGATGVQFNGTASTSFTVNSDASITAAVPAGAATGKITVAAPGGTATSAADFTVTTSSGVTITSFTPTAGPINVKVTINGTGFTGVSSVKFNGKAASFTVVSSTQLTANVSGGTTSGKITVTASGGTATSATDFTVAVAPTVTGFSPGSGTAGTSVVVTGTGFDTASAVAFNGFGATFTVNSPTQITATVPSTATTGKIKVTNAAGAASSGASFLVPPTVTSFSPASGHAGTSVVINGATFGGATSVTFNGTTATFIVNTSVKITATVPSGATTGKIAVTTASGTGTSTTDFVIGTGAAPTITSFSPTSGPVGTSVVVTGTNFGGASAVAFNGSAATFTLSGTTQITATVPTGATTGKISVTATGGVATSATSFTVGSGPAITGFTPASGPVGTSVSISGSGFTGATAVQFNGTSATSFTVNSDISIAATVPAGATTGKISVAAPGGTATSASNFTVTSGPAITGFTPASGPVGTSVSISGSGFTGATAVQFNGTSATAFTVNSDISVAATVPAGATTGKISVAAPGGTATSATDFVVSSSSGVTITSFTPTAGPISAKVTINGTGFAGVTSVKFNGKAAAFTVLSSTQLTATVSAATTSGKITVTASGGTATSATDFIVVSPPTVTGFTPGSGVPGTTVVITGTNFDTASAVAFNGFGATFTIDSSTQITATVPSTATTGKIKVTNPAGGASSAASFLVPPAITSFSPTSGRVGASVVINGKTFTGATSVTFNGVAATFSVSNSVKITATVPSGATSGKIAVTTPGGTATSTSDFTVLP